LPEYDLLFTSFAVSKCHLTSSRCRFLSHSIWINTLRAQSNAKISSPLILSVTTLSAFTVAAFVTRLTPRCHGFPRGKQNTRKEYHNERLLLAISVLTKAIYGTNEYYVDETKTRCVETNWSERL
jgi:hypothetical protein